jgi:hypothetical protein
MGHPELLVFGLTPSSAQALLNGLGDAIVDGRDLVPGEMIEDESGCRHHIIVEEVPNPGEIVLAANRFYRLPRSASVSVLQLTYADCDGRFPWDEGSAYADIQPRPGDFAA